MLVCFPMCDFKIKVVLPHDLTPRGEDWSGRQRSQKRKKIEMKEEFDERLNEES